MADLAVVKDLAAMLSECERLDEAMRVLRHALALAGDEPDLLTNFGAHPAHSGSAIGAGEVQGRRPDSRQARG